MNIRQLLWTVLCCISTVAPVAAFAQTVAPSAQVKSEGQLTIVNSLGYAPFEFTDASNQPAGLDIDLAMAAAKLVNAKLNIVTIPFASQIPALASGRAQIAWTPFSVLPERIKQVDFVTYMQAGTVASVLPAKKGAFSDQKGLCGKTIAVQTGSSADAAADKLMADCDKYGLVRFQKQIYPDQQGTIQAVLTGRADAMLDDSTVSGYYEATSKGKLVVAPGNYYSTPLAVAVRKGDKQSAVMVQALIDQLIKNGTYEAILKKYNMMSSAIPKSAIMTDASQL